MWNATPPTALLSHRAGWVAQAQELSLAADGESCLLFRLRRLPGKVGTGVPSTEAVGAAVCAHRRGHQSMDVVNGGPLSAVLSVKGRPERKEEPHHKG